MIAVRKNKHELLNVLFVSMLTTILARLFISQ
jgi:hypothetical protein